MKLSTILVLTLTGSTSAYTFGISKKVIDNAATTVSKSRCQVIADFDSFDGMS